MTTSQNGINLIKSFEGCSLKAYALGDGKITIGYGNTFYEDGSPVQMGDEITQERADALLLLIIPQFEKGVSDTITADINQNQFDALVDFSYNLGNGSLAQSTLHNEVNADPSNPDIKNQFLRWVEPGSKFEEGLTRRRTAEATLYFS